MEEKQAAVLQIRRFNRFYTPLIGLLDKNYLDSGYSVTENRILFELLDREKLTAKYLSELLLLDKGYISRVILSFEKKKLIVRTTSQYDNRSQDIALTALGKEEAHRVIEITNQKIDGLLDGLNNEDCRQICDAMRCIEEILVRTGR